MPRRHGSWRPVRRAVRDGMRVLDVIAVPGGNARDHGSRRASIAMRTGRRFIVSEHARTVQGGIGTRLRVVVLLLMSLVTAACCDRVACTEVPASSYNNSNGGA